MMKNKIFLKLLILCIPLIFSTLYAEQKIKSVNNGIGTTSNKPEDLSKSYIKKAQIHLNSGNYRKAHKLVLKALEIDKQLYGNIHKKTASDFSLLAMTLSQQGHHIRAATFFQKSQEIRKQLYNTKDIILTENLFGLAMINKAQAKYKSALHKHKEILRNRENLTHNNQIDIVRSLLEIANLEIILAYYTDAKLNIQRAEKITKQNINNDHPIYLTLLRQKSLLATENGYFNVADKQDKIILEKQIKLLGRNNVLVADTLTNIANRMLLNKKASLAIPLLQESQTIYKNEFGPKSLKFASNLSNMASANLKTGAYVKANNLNREASIISKIIFANNNHPLIARNLINQAHYLASKREYDAANQHLLDAQIIFETIFRSHHPKIAQLIAERAALYAKQKQFSKAKTHYLEAIKMLKTQLRTNHPALLSVLDEYDILMSNEHHHNNAIL